MKLISEDKRTVLRIEEKSADEYGIKLSIEVKDPEGIFCAYNEELHMASQSSKELKKFFKTRTGETIIDCSEGCELRFFSWDALGGVGVEYRIGKVRYEGETARDSNTYLQGTFKLDPEYSDSIGRELLEIIDA